MAASNSTILSPLPAVLSDTPDDQQPNIAETTNNDRDADVAKTLAQVECQLHVELPCDRASEDGDHCLDGQHDDDDPCPYCALIVDWTETVQRFKAARQLSDQRAKYLAAVELVKQYESSQTQN